jgi:thiamine biosynthesis lipoprotein
MKKNLSAALLFLLAIFGSAAFLLFMPERFSSKPSSEEFYALGTFIRFQAWGENAPEALEAARISVQALENRFSLFSPSSEVAILNSAAGLEERSFPEETLFLFSKALEYAKHTKGAFDPTIGPLTQLWGIGTAKEGVPSPEEIEKALGLVDYQNFQIFPERGTAALPRKGQAVDLGAIAKGYAGDVVREVLEKHAISQALIDMGGNIVTLGSKPGGSPWRIGIQNPLEPRGKYIGILSLSNASVVTSGNYERYFEKDGKRYHHIFDPFTGYPASQELLSVTVISPSSLQADALSTGLYVLGLSRGIQLATDLEGVEALFVTSDRRVVGTSGTASIFTLTEGSFSLEIRR